MGLGLLANRLARVDLSMDAPGAGVVQAVDGVMTFIASRIPANVLFEFTVHKQDVIVFVADVDVTVKGFHHGAIVLFLFTQGELVTFAPGDVRDSTGNTDRFACFVL